MTDCHLSHSGWNRRAFRHGHRELPGRRVPAPGHRPQPSRPAPRRPVYLAADFIIEETDIEDTACYGPCADAVIHYKRDNYAFLLSGQNGQGRGLSRVRLRDEGPGGWRAPGATARTAVSGNRAQGSVDSAIEVAVTVEPEGAATADFWIAVGRTLEAALEVPDRAAQGSARAALFKRREKVLACLGVPRPRAPRRHPDAGVEHDLSSLPPRVASLFRRSLLIIRTQTDNQGRRSWPPTTPTAQTNRALLSYAAAQHASPAHALDRADYGDIMRRPVLPGDALPKDRAALMHKYGPDAPVGSSWRAAGWDRTAVRRCHQEDETRCRSGRCGATTRSTATSSSRKSLYRSFTRPCADFLLAYRDPTRGCHAAVVGPVGENAQRPHLHRVRGDRRPRGGDPVRALVRRLRPGRIPAGRVRGARRPRKPDLGATTTTGSPGAWNATATAPARGT